MPGRRQARVASFDLTLLEDLPTVVLGGLRPEPSRKIHLVGVDANLHFNSGTVSRKKSSCSFGFCPNYLDPAPPLPQIWTTCTTFFERQCAKKFGQGSTPPPPHPQIDPIYSL